MISVRCVYLAVGMLGLAAQAAEPEFRVSVVTASRTFERQSGSLNVGGIATNTKTIDVSRVTVALDGVLITAEWEPKTLRSTTARDFRRGSDVSVARSRNRLLLKAPDGSIVTARIVDREKQGAAADER